MEFTYEPVLFSRSSAFASERSVPAERLTATEVSVIAALARGLTPSQIAAMQGTKLTTVRTHVRSIYSKLGVHCAIHALHAARVQGLI
jgi:LuxR family transcriptional regulator, maltose regulon positive regulatory protein